MSWSQQGSIWRRPLDCHDRLFQSISAAGKPIGREHWLLIGAAQISSPDPDAANSYEKMLRFAWAALRLRYPDIALQLDDDEKHYQPLLTRESLESWVNETFRVDSSAQSADELFTKSLEEFPASAMCYWIPATSEVAIVSSHWRWDGRGLTMILHEFLSELAKQHPSPTFPVLDDEARRLLPSMDVLIGMPDVPNDTWVQLADELLSPFLREPSSIGLPIIPSALPGETRRVVTMIRNDVATAVRAACRMKGLSLTAALHASVVQLTSEYQSQPISDTARYKSWAAFDVRKYLAPPFDGPSHAPSLRMLALPIDVKANASWQELVAVLQPLYKQSFSEDSDMLYVRVPYVEKATAMLAEATPTTDPNLSNLGILDNFVQKKYADIAVKNVWVAPRMISPQLYCHVWSWAGDLYLSVSYNVAFYEADFVSTWSQSVRDNMLRNLGVQA